MHRQLTIGSAALLILLLAAGGVSAHAKGAQSGGSGPFVDRWVIAGGGVPSTGGDVTLIDTLGEPIVGPATDRGVALDAGYRQQIFAPAAVADLRASATTGYLQLDWVAVTLDTSCHAITGVTYNVYRAQDAPYFVPDAANETGLTSPTFTDPDATVIGDTAHSTYYLVRAVNGGLLAGPSDRMGIFSFRLAPGN